MTEERSRAGQRAGRGRWIGAASVEFCSGAGGRRESERLLGGWPAGVAALEDRRRARKAKMAKISAGYGVVSGRIAHEHPPV